MAEQLDQDLERAVRRRTATKGWLKRYTGNLKAFVDGEKPVQGNEKELGDALLQFEKKLEDYDKAQGEVETLTALENLDEEIDKAFLYITEIRQTYLSARGLLQPVQNSDGTSEHENDLLSVSSHQQQYLQRHASLPKLQLPKFDGQFTEWQSWWDKFNAVVHESSLPTISKFTYLQSLLRGDAANCIKGLSLTEANYNIACSSLKERFGRPERIVFSHIQELLNLQITGADTEALWTMYDSLQGHIRSLEALDISGTTYGVILTPLVLHRLPESVRLEWARTGEGKESDLQALMEFLFNEIKRQERSGAFSSNNKRREKTRPPPGSSAAALVATGATGLCNFCEKDHRGGSEKCYSIQNLSSVERKERCMQRKLCFVCFGKHLASVCKSKRRCLKCGGKHHVLLCKVSADGARGRSNSDSHQSSSLQIDSSHGDVQNDSCLSACSQPLVASKVQSTILQMASVKVSNGRNSGHIVRANVLFDSGSDRSYISSAFARKLQASCVGEVTSVVALFGEPGPKRAKRKKQFSVAVFRNNGILCEKLLVTESPVICSPIFRPDIPTTFFDKLEAKGLSSVDEVRVNSDQQVQIDILIGLDYYWRLVKPNILSLSKDICAQETVFGWMVSGSVKQTGTRQDTVLVSHQLLCMNDLCCQKFWDLDCFGISDHEGSDTLSKGSRKVLDDFNTSLRFENGRYTVHLPWKADKRGILENNLQSAERRADTLKRKMDSNPSLSSDYDKVLSDLENESIIHEVPRREEDSAGLTGDSNIPIFYLPHRPVLKESSLTTKIRPVFDASAKGPNGVSLNDCIEAGPNLLPNLAEILIGFRKWKYGVTADITKAFLQIRVTEDDQDVHRFLWDVNGHRRVMRFDRVIFGNVCSPFLLNATIKFHLSQFKNSYVVDQLRNSLYVDDWLSGADTEKELSVMIREAKEIMTKGGFPLAKWGSNSSIIQENEENLGHSVISSPFLKVLGISWSTKDDFFFFESAPLAAGMQFTKRLVLSFIARIFDPLGFLTPFEIAVKILFQEIWQSGYDWDDPLSSELQEQVSAWVGNFEKLRLLRIPRCLAIDIWAGIKRCELHCFSDASEKAYGCCIYLKVWGEHDEVKSSLVASKARVAPLKRVTLPRLELLGALTGARLMVFVRKALGLPVDTDYQCYTDSEIVLHWIRGDANKWKQFVGNRVSEIQSLTSPSNWKHCNGHTNPADLVTRGVSAQQLLDSFWLHGPEWLSNDSESVPMSDLEEQTCTLTDEICSVESKKYFELENHTLNVLYSCTETMNVQLLDYKRLSSFSKLGRVVSWVLRFIENLRSKDKRNLSKDLSSDEFEKGKAKLFLCIQKEVYSQEFVDLEKDGVVKRTSSISQLAPFIGLDGLLRVHTRLDKSQSLLYNEKNPILLPKCHVTFLLVRAQHESMSHAGVSTLLTVLRNNYWIIALRSIAKHVYKQCVECQRQESKPCGQITAPLPEDRISKAKSFSIVGIDHAGPLFCSDFPEKKLYILLITCAVTRAIHVELVDSLSLEDFFYAFRRFAARRGFPTVVYSDNSKTFQGADHLLQRKLGHLSILWKFSAPLAPWWGGWWERLVRSVKSALKRSLGKKLVTKAQLETSLHEVEACVNSRPLTYVSDYEHVLTPSHFLIGRNSPLIVTGIGNVETINTEMSDELMIRHKLESEAIDLFWEIWKNEYIRNLPPMGSGKDPQCTDIMLGSVVLIKEDGKSRLQWPMGIVTRLFPGRDGLIRAVQLKTSKGTICRAVQRLHRLEMLESPPAPPNTDLGVSQGAEEAPQPDTDRNVSPGDGDAPQKFSSKGRLLKPKNVLNL